MAVDPLGPSPYDGGMATKFRKYNPDKDKKATHTIWQECGWIEDEKKHKEALDRLVASSSAWVYAVDGTAEAMTVSTPAKFHHTGTVLSLAAITAVTTSRVARGRGAATGTIARSIAESGAAGIAVAGLGMFEQGFYDRFGFGNGPYELFYRFDPAWLKPFEKPAPPVRIGPRDWKAIHAGRLARHKQHGAVDLIPDEVSRCEMEWSKGVFGLGYKSKGKLTHFFVGRATGENGPYMIDWIVYQDLSQLRELLSLIRGLGDQVRSVRMKEIPRLQLQALLERPFQLQTITRKGPFESHLFGEAFWQLRILDVRHCVASVKAHESVAFTLKLTDPLSELLPADGPWHGCGGSYVVRLGEESEAEPGEDKALPTLEATVNDFTRFWMGSASAAVLAGLHSFRGPAELIEALDAAVALPSPYPDWDY